MAEEKEQDPTVEKAPEKGNQDEIALELMKFITVTTGYGKGSPGAGFGGKSTLRTPEEQAEVLIELYQRCRKAVREPIA